MSEPRPLIMVVDDNPRNLRVMGNTLESSGYEPVVFLNARDALAFLSEERPDLVLLDVMMPEMDGYRLCGEIRNIDPGGDIPIIFLTAKAEPGKGSCFTFTIPRGEIGSSE